MSLALTEAYGADLCKQESQKGLLNPLTIPFIPHYNEIHAQSHNLLPLLLRIRIWNIRPPEKEVLPRRSDKPVASFLVQRRICMDKALQYCKRSVHMAEVVVHVQIADHVD